MPVKSFVSSLREHACLESLARSRFSCRARAAGTQQTTTGTAWQAAATSTVFCIFAATNALGSGYRGDWTRRGRFGSYARGPGFVAPRGDSFSGTRRRRSNATRRLSGRTAYPPTGGHPRTFDREPAGRFLGAQRVGRPAHVLSGVLGEHLVDLQRRQSVFVLQVQHVRRADRLQANNATVVTDLTSRFHRHRSSQPKHAERIDA